LGAAGPFGIVKVSDAALPASEGDPMKGLFQAVQAAARMGYAVLAWVLVAMVFVQVFYAGMAVLVNPGDWGSHRSFGSMLSLPIMLMVLLSLAGRMPYRFFLSGLSLYALYVTQYLLLYLPGRFELPILCALHPVNALVILLTASSTAKQAWRLARNHPGRSVSSESDR
jgi:hypothetical protein